MRLDLTARARIRAGRQLARLAFGVPALYGRLRDTRRGEVARGLDPDVAVMLAAGELIGQTAVVAKSPAFERRELAISVGMADERPRGRVDVRNLRVTGAVDMLGARLYSPAGLPAVAPGVVFVHGGGWVTGDLDTHDGLCRRLALTGRIRVLAVDVRLAPEHPFPAPVDDSVAAFRYVAGRARELGFDPNRLGIFGDSAGGNLSAVVGLETRSDPIRPRLTALLYPALDATCSQPSHRTNGRGYFLTEEAIRWYLGHYLGSDPQLPTHPRVSPFHAPDLRGAPEALVVVAGFDPLLDEGVRYAERLEEAGSRVTTMRFSSLPHGFALMTRLSRASLEATVAIARRTGELLRA